MSTYNPNNAPGYGQQGGQFGGAPQQGGQYNASGPYPGQGGGQFGPGAGGAGGPGGQYGGGGVPPGGRPPYGPQGGGQYGGGGMPPKQSQSKITTLLIVGVIGALLIGVVAWLVFGRNPETPPPPTPPSTSSSPSSSNDPSSDPSTDPSPSGQTTEPSPSGQTTEPAPPSGNEIDLGQGVVVALPAGWTLEDSEPGIALVTNGMAYITLQVFRSEASVDAMTVMTAYAEQMKESFQNPQVSGPEAIDVGPDGTGAVMVIVGNRTSSSGSFEAVLGSTMATRSADGVSILSSMLTVPQGWDPSIDDYNRITSDMLGDLLG